MSISNNGENQQFELLDLLTIFSVAMQMANYEELQKQATNNDLMTELRQDVSQIQDSLRRIEEKLDNFL